MTLHTSIFMETPSLERLPTKTKEDPLPHEMRLSPHWTSTQYFLVSGKLLLLLLLLLLSSSLSSSFSLLKNSFFSRSLLSLFLIPRSLMSGAFSRNLLRPFFSPNVKFLYQRANQRVLYIKMFNIVK